MSDEMGWLAVAAMGGILLGTIWGRWAEASIWRGKCGNEVGHRTAMCSGGRFYYVVTEREYVDKVMGPLTENEIERRTLAVQYSDQHPYGAP